MADIEFSVRVVDQQGNGLPEISVSVFYPLSWDTQMTDHTGTAYFERNLMQPPQGDVRLQVKITASHNHVQKVSVGDGETVLFKI